MRNLGVREGDVVVMDDPTYFLVADIVRACGASIRLVPMLPDGPDVNALERVLSVADARVRALYIAGPCYHNPTGAVTSPEKARMLIGLAEKHEFFVVADEPYALMGFGDAARRGSTSIKIHESLGSFVGDRPSASRPSSRVISLGSFSKILAPGLRLGWLHACPALVSEVFGRDPALGSGGGVNPFVAHLVHKALFAPDASEMSARLTALNDAAAKKARALSAAIVTHFGDAVEFVRPEGGYFLWCRFTGKTPGVADGKPTRFDTDASDFRKWLLQPHNKEAYRVCFLHGDRCKACDEGDRRRFRGHFRCSWAFYDEFELVEGVRRLRCAWEKYVSEKMSL